VIVVAVVTVAVLAAASLILLRSTPRTGPNGTGQTGTGQVGATPPATPGLRSHLGFTLAEQEVNGLRLRPVLASGDKQTATIGSSDRYMGDITAELTVYEPGRYRRMPGREDEPVDVNGHAGFFGQGRSSFAMGPVPALEWEYRPGAWAVLNGMTEPVLTREQLVAMAADVRLGEPYEPRVPCRFGYLPAGLRAISVSGAATRQDAQPRWHQPLLRLADGVPGDVDVASFDADPDDGAAVEVMFWAVGPGVIEPGAGSETEDVGGYPGVWRSDRDGTSTVMVYLPGTIVIRVKVDAGHLEVYPRSEIANIVRELDCAPLEVASWPTVSEAVRH
jgi:hypothetical protein